MGIRNLSRYQSYVGQTFTQDGCKVCCLAAHKEAILVLRFDSDGQPANYIVCHRPEVRSGKISWGFGDYFTILNYQHCGRSDPMSAAFSDAVRCLLDPQILAFRFEPMEDEEAAVVYAEVPRALSQDEIDSICDCISSYADSVASYTYEQCVDDVLKSYPQLSHRLLQPAFTFHI